MKSKVSVRWLKNHGIRVITENNNGKSERFAPGNGYVTVAVAAAALGTYPVKLYRLIDSKAVKSHRDPFSGDCMIPVGELWRLRREPAA